MTRIVALVVMLVAAAPARASDLVLYQGTDPSAALAQVAREAHVDAATLHASTLTALLQGRPPALENGGSVQVCTRAPASRDDLAASMKQAESAMAYLEYDKALKTLDEAATLLGCLSTPADPADAGRLYYLRGLVLYFTKQPTAAKAAWAQAHRFAPDMKWDDDFPPDGKPLFEQACKEADAQPIADVQLDPPLDKASPGLWIDGRPTTPESKIIVPPQQGGHIGLSPGDHLVQYGTAAGVTTARITLDAGTHPTLVIPEAVVDGDLIWVSNGSEALLSTLLAAVLGKDAKAYVVWNGSTYAGAAGAPDWKLLEHVAAPKAPATRAHHTRYLATTGFAVAGAAALVSGVAYARAKKFVRQVPSTPDLNAYDTIEKKYRANRIIYGVSNGLIVLGGVVGAVGIYVPLADGVGLAPGPRGITLEIRR